MQEYIKKILGSGRRNSYSSASHNTTALIISNNETEDTIKIVKSLEDLDLLLNVVTKTVQNEVKEQKGEFLSMLLGTLVVSLLGNILAGWGINRAGEGAIATRQGRGIVRVGCGSRFSKMYF